ncbi:60S ribosomal protein L37 [Fukomys damarensis]|uniref:60S ribosomal protein L37 n=1 Tax=Fukomys damarensis TaxID=885580 RepID=A0A091CSS0_FUKDA|nr:60S ribosomal protein L37 [Fukomys damarensis]
MTKGASSFGKRRNETHTLCRRCGSKAYAFRSGHEANVATLPSARETITRMQRRKGEKAKNHRNWENAAPKFCVSQIREWTP